MKKNMLNELQTRNSENENLSKKLKELVEYYIIKGTDETFSERIYKFWKAKKLPC